jgi:hypothetical protein
MLDMLGSLFGSLFGSFDGSLLGPLLGSFDSSFDDSLLGSLLGSLEFGDILALGGMAVHNVLGRWICKLNDLKLKGKEVSIPVEYQDQPPFWDHSYLHYLNECAKDHKLPPLFPNTTPVNEDNGINF